MSALSMLLGAALVVFGVLASALADRIRGLKIARPQAREPRELAPRKEASAPVMTDAHVRLGNDVKTALVQMGYSKHEASAAIAECKGSEQASLEAWTRAALKKLAIA